MEKQTCVPDNILQNILERWNRVAGSRTRKIKSLLFLYFESPGRVLVQLKHIAIFIVQIMLSSLNSGGQLKLHLLELTYL